MAIQKREVDFAKEIDDVMAVVVDIIKAVKSKKPLGELAAAEFPALVTAIEGVGQIAEELKASKTTVLETIGFRTGEIAGALLE